MAKLCEKCSTALDDQGACVTCGAEAEGLRLGGDLTDHWLPAEA